MRMLIQAAFFSILVFLQSGALQAKVYPIQFSISEEKIIDHIPQKEKDFATIVPGDLSTYVFTEESDYYGDYQKSYFAFTWKKGGWDCMRHYEILANGCIPYFVDLDKVDENTMYLLPKDLIMEAMSLPGVSYGKIDHTLFDENRYNEILSELLEYTRNHLSAKNMASWLLESIGYSGSGKILYLSNDLAPDYMRCCTLIGLKELLGDRVVDVPQIPHIYQNYPGDVKQIYGKGFSYTKILPDLPVDRSNVELQIMERNFDLVIYGSVHRGLPYLNLVEEFYSPDEVFYICGEDYHKCGYSQLPHLFLREYEALQ